jgi:two-component system LytT family response regulator
MWRALVADDEPMARARVKRLVADDPEVTLVGECEDGVQSLEAIRRLRPDLLFLDVQMPGLDGFAVLSELAPAEVPVTIFLTAHDRYALEAFEAAAADYLLKPFGQDRFHRALARAKALLGSHNMLSGAAPPDAEPAAARADAEGRRFLVKAGGRVFALAASEVDWIESCGNYVKLHAGDKGWLLRDTMEGVESGPGGGFVRVHRTALVNPARIAEVASRALGRYELTLLSGAKLTLSRRCRRKLQASLGDGWKALLALGEVR